MRGNLLAAKKTAGKVVRYSLQRAENIEEDTDMTNIQKAEAFLKEQFANCAYFMEHPADGEYRLQHSYRVAYAAGEIARREGLGLRHPNL